MIERPRRFALLLALAGAAACADAPRDPVALLVAPEARAALEVGSTLPALPELARRAGRGEVSGDLATAETLWRTAAQAGDPAAASSLREQAYALAAEPLAATIDSAALAGAQARLERWITLAGAVLRHSEIRELSSALSDAETLLASARAAEARHDRAAAVVATLRASDRLAETTPPAVAARLSAENEAALSALSHVAGRPVGEEARRRLERIDRLVRGAREALAGGQYETAIRRGYYARQLLVAEGALQGGKGQ